MTTITSLWTGFEAWVAGWWPGFKTMIVTALGALGSLAAIAQDYLTQVTGLPNNVISGAQIGTFTLVMFTLAFWLRGIGDRVNTRAASNT